MSASKDVRHMVVSDSEGGLFQWSGKASVVELLKPNRPSSQFPEGGRIHVYASARLSVIEVMGDALMAAFQVRKTNSTGLFVFRDATWTAVPTKAHALADSLGMLTHDPYPMSVVIDFSEINEKRLKKVEKLFVEAHPGRIKDPAALRKRLEEYGQKVKKTRARPAPPVEVRVPKPVVTVEDSQDIASELVQLEQNAAARRSALADDWPTAATVSRTMGSTAGNASQLATRLRRAGELLAVYLPVPGGSWRFPRWQFRNDGQPVEHLKEILRVLREDGNFYDSQRRTTGWGEVEWFISGHLLLDGRTPAEVLVTDPIRVLEAARQEFSVNS